MKVSELPYRRVTLEEVSGVLEDVLARVKNADSADAILAAWEDVCPGDLANTIDIYRSALTGARYTRLRRRDEIISDIVYIPVVINCAAVLLNFLYIAYFLEQKELLSLFF